VGEAGHDGFMRHPQLIQIIMQQHVQHLGMLGRGGSLGVHILTPLPAGLQAHAFSEGLALCPTDKILKQGKRRHSQALALL
jgi:hypothetical protein